MERASGVGHCFEEKKNAARVSVSEEERCLFLMWRSRESSQEADRPGRGCLHREQSDSTPPFIRKIRAAGVTVTLPVRATRWQRLPPRTEDALRRQQTHLQKPDIQSLQLPLLVTICLPANVLVSILVLFHK